MSTYDASDGTEGSALRAIDWPTKCGLAGSRIARSKPNFPATASMRCESATARFPAFGRPNPTNDRHSDRGTARRRKVLDPESAAGSEGFGDNPISFE